jgi:hypothetical protein
MLVNMPISTGAIRYGHRAAGRTSEVFRSQPDTTARFYGDQVGFTRVSWLRDGAGPGAG